MKMNMLKSSIYIALLAAGSAQAADTYSLPGTTTGNFDFYDKSGTYQASSSHTDVSGSINFTTGSGQLTTATPFTGGIWVADIGEMFFYDGAVGGATQNFTFDIDYKLGQDADFNTVNCSVSANFDGCTGFLVTEFVSTPVQYTFTLSEGQFAFGMYFDWTTSNDIPVLAVFDTTSIAVDGKITVTAVDSDSDGSPGTAMLVGPFPGQTPAFSGVFTAETNDAPITDAVSALSTNEDTALNLSVNASDFTINSLAFPARVYKTASKKLFIGSGTNYNTNSTSSITPTSNFPTDNATSGTLTVPVGITIDDGVMTPRNSVAQNVSVTVNAQDDPPIISGTPATVAVQGNIYSFVPTASDPDFGDTISFTNTTKPSWATFNTITGEITGTPGGGDVGLTTTGVDIAVIDSGGATSVPLTPFDILVRSNTAPTIVSGAPPASQITNEDSLFSFAVTYADSDIGNTESLTCLLTGNPDWMSVAKTSPTVCTVSGTPANDDVGSTAGIAVGVNDLAGDSVSSIFAVSVANTNDAPTIAAGSCTTTTLEATTAYNCAPEADDIDVGDILTFSATGLPVSGNLSIDTSTGAISGAPTNSDAGVHTIVITVSDSTVSVPLASYDLTVDLFDAPPTVTSGLFKIPADADYSDTIVNLATDPESCGCVTFRQEPASGNTSFGTIVVNANGTFTYSPNAGYNGTDSFSYIASDAAKDSVKATVQFIVGEVTGETYAGSNFTMFDAGGANANGGTNDVIASWDGLFNADESDADFTHMTLSSITPYFGELWTAHHIRVFGPGTYTFDTTCTVAELEAGKGGPGQLCNNPLDAGQIEQFITMTVASGQVGAHILFDWSVNLNIDVLNVWNTNSEFDVSANPGTGVLYNGEGYGPYPWSGAPAADTSWRLASTDNDGDGIPGIQMVDGAFIDFNANFNLFVGSGAVCVPVIGNNFCGTMEVNVIVSDPELGGGSIFGLLSLYLTWLCIRFGFRWYLK